MSGPWPPGVQSAVCFTFDVEGATEFLAMDSRWARHSSLMSMCAFGPRDGVPRVLDLLDAYSIKGTFFVPGQVAEKHPNMVRDVVSRGHEVGARGYLFERPATSSHVEQEQSLIRGTDILRSLTGQPPVGYRAPGPDTSSFMLGLLKERGFLYDSSLMGNDIPYWVDTDHGQLVEIPIHWSLMDKPHYMFAYEAGRVGSMASVEQVHRNWLLEFEGSYRLGRCLTLALDPGYSGYYSRLAFLEQLIQRIVSCPSVIVIPAVDLARMMAAKSS